ncbi:MAG: hypothetical protein H6651_06665 [Ardenticatenales bacterium]|nr:hypothetical protein [Ardenticatenales bacterium]
MMYQIILKGQLHPCHERRLAPLTLRHLPDGNSCLEGLLADQAALFGLLLRLRDIGIPLLSLRAIEVEVEVTQ